MAKSESHAIGAYLQASYNSLFYRIPFLKRKRAVQVVQAVQMSMTTGISRIVASRTVPSKAVQSVDGLKSPVFAMPSSNDTQPPGAGSPGDLTGLHILLVEDSPDIGELVKTFLELEGTTVAGPAPTAAEARKLMAERQPHVALVDFHLRDGNTYELIARLRGLGVPVVMISGSIECPLPISLEGVTMLEKPFSEAQLLGCLRLLMAKKAAR
jgi:CheY-like chemotaxis protein